MQSQAIIKLDTSPGRIKIFLDTDEIYILCKTLRSSLSRLKFEYLAQKNNLIGGGEDWDYTRALEDEIKANTSLLARLEGTPDKAALETQLEADVEALERITLASVAYLFAAEREAAG